MAKLMALTKFAKFATVSRKSGTRKYRLTPSSRYRAINLMFTNEERRHKRFFITSTTGLSLPVRPTNRAVDVATPPLTSRSFLQSLLYNSRSLLKRLAAWLAGKGEAIMSSRLHKLIRPPVLRINKKTQNYAVIEKDGQMVAQVMEGGMFGSGNVVVIDNRGIVTPVKSPQQGNAVLQNIINKAG
jgi:hypothetical protein